MVITPLSAIFPVGKAHGVRRITGLQRPEIVSSEAEMDDLAGVENGLPRGSSVHAPAFIRRVGDRACRRTADAFIVTKKAGREVDILLRRIGD